MIAPLLFFTLSSRGFNESSTLAVQERALLECEPMAPECDGAEGRFDAQKCCGCYVDDQGRVCNKRRTQRTAFLFQLFFGYTGAGAWYLCQTEMSSVFIVGLFALCCCRCFETQPPGTVGTEAQVKELRESCACLVVAGVMFCAWIVLLVVIGNNKMADACTAEMECVPISWECAGN